ncbi:hypothetical protein MASR2M78_14730 [Treponema sp.]
MIKSCFASLIMVLGLLLAAPSLSAAEKSAFFVDLNEQTLYARPGFDVLPSSIPDASDTRWQTLPPSGGKGRTMRLIDLKREGKRRFLSPFSSPPVHYTYLIPFSLNAADMETLANTGEAPLVPGMHLAALGDNWEIYLNGTRLQSMLFLDKKGNILSGRGHRDIAFSFSPALLQEGTNFLVFHIIGDPNYAITGMYQADPYYISDYAKIQIANLELWPVTLCGLYLFIGLYHIFIFFVRRKDLQNLFYGLFSIDLAIYLFSRTHSVQLIIEDSNLISKIELASLFLVVPILGAFLDILIVNKVSRTTKIYALFCFGLALVQAATPLYFGYDLLRVWQFTALAMALYYFGYSLFWQFISVGYRRWKRYQGSAQQRSLGREYLRVLIDTPIGNLFIGGVILFFTAIFDIVDAIYFSFDIVASQYGFFVFTMGTALVLANRFSFLHSQLSLLNRNLEGRINALTEATGKIEMSEKKYRSLFDASGDPVVLLDEEMRFSESNKAALDFFGLDRSKGKPLALPDTLYTDERDLIAPRERLTRAIEALRGSSVPLELPVRVRTPLGEAKACRYRMEHIRSSGRGEILLRVIPEETDALSRAFVEGRERYDIESTLAEADDVCRRACAHLNKYIPQDDASFMQVCLREIVINAIEHGNLRISFEEKTRAQSRGAYFEFLQQRQRDPEYRERKATIEYSITKDRAVFRISDQGDGFDHRRFLRKAEEPTPELLEHGRGLFMTLAAFDSVAYNDKGNQVTLEKRFSIVSKKA